MGTEATSENPQRREACGEDVLSLTLRTKEEELGPSLVASRKQPLAKPDLLWEKEGTGDNCGSSSLTINIFAARGFISGLIGIRQFCHKR